MLVEAVVDLLWSVGIGIAGITGAILLLAGGLLLGKKGIESAMEYKVTQKERVVIANLQQRAIETHQRAELAAGTRRIQATIDEAIIIRHEVEP